MKHLYVFFLILFSCTLKPQVDQATDDFSKILEVMKTRSISDLTKFFGEPDDRRDLKLDQSYRILEYKKQRLDAYVKISDENKISHITLFFFEDFDNYAYLKKRFKNYKWVETKLSDPLGDVATDLHQVRIPEIGMKFEYDNLAPKRKVMWIYFE